MAIEETRQFLMLCGILPLEGTAGPDTEADTDWAVGVCGFLPLYEEDPEEKEESSDEEDSYDLSRPPDLPVPYHVVRGGMAVTSREEALQLNER